MERRTSRVGRALACVGAALVLGHASARDGPVRRPNLLLLLADDQRADTLSAFGNPHLETPALDRLVAEGFAFRRAYCLGSPHGAVCLPSRAMLHTGEAYFGMDLVSFDRRPTLGQLLGAAGYRTFAVGKWHNGHGALKRSFQGGAALLLGPMSNHRRVPLVDLVDGALTEERLGKGHSTRLFTDAAVAFLAGLPPEDDAPFFLYVAYTAPHDPRDPPTAYRERASRAALPESFLPQHPFDNGFLVGRDEMLLPWPRPPELLRDQLDEYYGLVEYLDQGVGRVLAALEASGRAEETLVVYAADHGLALGSHGLLGKQSVYEHSLRAPLVVRGPGVPHGESEALVYLHDLFPTLLSRAGLAPRASDSAADLAPLWRGERERVRDTLFLSMGRSQRAVSDGRWKLIRYPEVDVTQLFDLESDPHELHDLARDEPGSERVGALRRELEAWQERLGDDVAWTAEDTRPQEVDLTGFPTYPDPWQPRWIREKYFDE